VGVSVFDGTGVFVSVGSTVGVSVGGVVAFRPRGVLVGGGVEVAATIENAPPLARINSPATAPANNKNRIPPALRRREDLIKAILSTIYRRVSITPQRVENPTIAPLFAIFRISSE